MNKVHVIACMFSAMLAHGAANAEGSAWSDGVDAAMAPPPPTCTSFKPTAGQADSVFRITGTNFVNVLGVYLLGEPAHDYSVLSSTSIWVRVAPDAPYGSYPITISTLSGTVRCPKLFRVL